MRRVFVGFILRMPIGQKQSLDMSFSILAEHSLACRAWSRLHSKALLGEDSVAGRREQEPAQGYHNLAAGNISKEVRML